METQHEGEDICRSMGGSVRDNKTHFHDTDHICYPVEKWPERSCSLQLLKAISCALRTGPKAETKPRNLPKEEPLSESSDDSKFEISSNNDRRYPERRRGPPDRYTCN